MTTLKTTAEQSAMSEVKRWNVTNENALWAAGDGRFVKASDYDALKKHAERLEQELNDAKELLKCTAHK